MAQPLRPTAPEPPDGGPLRITKLRLLAVRDFLPGQDPLVIECGLSREVTPHERRAAEEVEGAEFGRFISNDVVHVTVNQAADFDLAERQSALGRLEQLGTRLHDEARGVLDEAEAHLAELRTRL